MSVDREYIQRARIVYSKMTLMELLAEENMVQKYLFKHGDDGLARKLYALLIDEINRKLR